MYARVFEQKVADVTFDENDFNNSENMDDPYNMIDRLDEGLDILGKPIL
jgi:hypothetical protein